MLSHRVTDLSMRAMNGVHRALLAVSGGRIGWKIGPMAVVELHTVGRTSGVRRSTMLTAPIHEADRVVLVASKDNTPPLPTVTGPETLKLPPERVTLSMRRGPE